MGLFSGLANFAKDLISNGTGGLSSIINNTANLISNERQNALNRKAQAEMNDKNIAMTQQINAQNIANQNAQNEITRQREDNAYQRAAKDIELAGMSKQLLTGGASASPMNVAQAVAPQGEAFTGNKATSYSGDVVSGALTAALSASAIKALNKVNGEEPTNGTNIQTVTTPSGDKQEVPLVSAASDTPHYNTRSVPGKKILPTLADSSLAPGISNAINAANNVMSSPKQNVTTKEMVANVTDFAKKNIAPQNMNALVKFLKLVTVTADGNTTFDKKLGGDAAYERQVPKLLKPVCVDLISSGAAKDQAEAQMIIKDIAVTIKQELPMPSNDELMAMFGKPGLSSAWENAKKAYDSKNK